MLFNSVILPSSKGVKILVDIRTVTIAATATPTLPNTIIINGNLPYFITGIRDLNVVEFKGMVLNKQVAVDEYKSVLDKGLVMDRETLGFV